MCKCVTVGLSCRFSDVFSIQIDATQLYQVVFLILGIYSGAPCLVYEPACKFGGWHSRVEIGASSVESNHSNLLMFDRKRFCVALHKTAKREPSRPRSYSNLSLKQRVANKRLDGVRTDCHCRNAIANQDWISTPARGRSR